MDRTQAHKLIDELFDAKEAGVATVSFNAAGEGVPIPAEELPPAKVLPEGKRAVRSKSSGDRVYLLDDVKKTRQWFSNPEVMASHGFDMNDVVDIEDKELMTYSMGPALFK